MSAALSAAAAARSEIYPDLGILARAIKSASRRDLDRLRTVANFHTSSSNLAAALRQVANDREPPPGPNIAEQAAIRATAEAAIAATVDRAAAERERQQRAAEARAEAEAGVAILDRLPPVHAAALLRSAGCTERRVAALRNRISDTEAQQQIAAAVQRYNEIAPPPSECTARGAALVRGDEGDIRAEAHTLAALWTDFYRVHPNHPHDQPTRAERECDRWWRRRLRREALRAQRYFDCALRLARPDSLYCSSYTLAAYADRQARNRAWAEGTVVRWDDGDEVPLLDVIENGKKSKRAQMYALVKSLEYAGKTLEYTPFFLTLTLPGEWHSYASGPRVNGSYPAERENENWTPDRGPQAQLDELNRRWKLLRARLAKTRALRKYFGILVPEPHKSGTPHFHVMIWLPTRFARRGNSRSTRILLLRLLREIAPGRNSDLRVIDKASGGASPASYAMKYVLKSLGEPSDAPDSEAPDGEEHLHGEPHERYRAWLSAGGMRSSRLLGIHGGLRIWQRLWTAADDEELPDRARAARACIAAGRESGAAAEQESDPAERAKLRDDQAAEYAEALAIIGALPQLRRADDEPGALKLRYESTENSYGRETRRPVEVIDTETGEVFPLKRRAAKLVPVTKPQNAAASKHRTDQLPSPVTVVAIVPRAAPAARPAADHDSIQVSIAPDPAPDTRESARRWAEIMAEIEKNAEPPPLGLAA